MDSAPRHRARRAQVLDTLRGSEGPLGVTEVARMVGVHANTARFHLDALVAEGAAVRVAEAPAGRGRPRTAYAPRPGMDRGGGREYPLLARILLSRLAAAGPEGGEAARLAGRDWGRYLVDRPPPYREPGDEEATARLTDLLAGLGFAPEPAAGGGPAGQGTGAIRLRHCPFLELAEEYGPLVCGIHLGLMQGALAELGAGVTADRLEPFAEPAACLAHLRPVPPAERHSLR
jgi:predicted ArsR family transcriptional regulator